MVVIKKVKIVVMAPPRATVALFSTVTTYSEKLAAVIQNYSFTSNESYQVGFDGALITLNGTIWTLKKLAQFVTDHVEHEKEIFSYQGLEYAHLLITECGNTLFGIETIMTDASLSREERKVLEKEKKKERKEEQKRRAEKREERKKNTPQGKLSVMDWLAGDSFREKNMPLGKLPVAGLLALELNEENILKGLKKGINIWYREPFRRCISRLHILQLHLHLLCQVVQVGALSIDV